MAAAGIYGKPPICGALGTHLGIDVVEVAIWDNGKYMKITLDWLVDGWLMLNNGG